MKTQNQDTLGDVRRKRYKHFVLTYQTGCGPTAVTSDTPIVWQQDRSPYPYVSIWKLGLPETNTIFLYLFIYRHCACVYMKMRSTKKEAQHLSRMEIINRKSCSISQADWGLSSPAGNCISGVGVDSMRHCRGVSLVQSLDFFSL